MKGLSAVMPLLVVAGLIFLGSFEARASGPVLWAKHGISSLAVKALTGAATLGAIGMLACNVQAQSCANLQSAQQAPPTQASVVLKTDQQIVSPF